jgi:hypothetical protein
MFHPEGYGGIFLKDLIYNPHKQEGLLFAACLENSQPATTSDRAAIHDIIAKNLSVNVDIVQASTLEAFFDGIEPSTLPTYDGEIGDVWNRAVMGDPKKAQLLRAFGRAYEPHLDTKPTVKRLLLEAFALSAGEHNFGK